MNMKLIYNLNLPGEKLNTDRPGMSLSLLSGRCPSEAADRADLSSLPGKRKGETS
jgi:hypothetical protein